MAPAPIPTGSDLAAHMGRSDPGDFDALVAQWVERVSEKTVADPWEYQHTQAVLEQAALDVDSYGKRGGVELTEYGPIYTRPVTVAMGNLLKHRAVGGFA